MGTEPDECEIFVLTSEHEYHLAREARDRSTQAILFISPDFRLPNEDDLDTVFDLLINENCQYLMATLGVGILIPGLSSETYEYAKLRYGKVIIVAEHPALTELVRFFETYMPDLLLKGHIYVPENQLGSNSDQTTFQKEILNPNTRRLRVIDRIEI